MYIKNVKIKNFRNFRSFEVDLNPFSILIGENDVGKSNFLEALSLPLSNNDFQRKSKSLKLSDINADAVDEFIEYIEENEEDIRESIENEKRLDKLFKMIPRVEVEVSFVSPQNAYERSLLKDWINENEDEEIVYNIQYVFKPKKNIEVIEILLDASSSGELSSVLLPVNLYEYNIYSLNNNKRIVYKKMSNFGISIINAERDTFSESDHQKSNRLVSELLERNLDNSDRNKIHSAYIDFFEEIEEAKSFKKAFEHLEEADYINITDYVDAIKLIPNFPNLRNIFSNISVGYGSEFLHQRGLGTRNFVLMMLLFSYYYSNNETYNLISIEEPEAHLCVNNFNLVLDYIEKSINQKNSLTQVIMTSHNPKVINKLKLNNVIVLTNNGSVSFQDIEDGLVKYLSKRPNFDILKLLFSRKTILVEGPTEEMLINSLLSKEKNYLSDIEVIAVGHKGFRKYLDIWLKLNKNNTKRKIGIIRDFDDQLNAKLEHDKYDDENYNILVRTTQQYTLEDDLVKVKGNSKKISNFFSLDSDDEADVAEYLKDSKASNMFDLAVEMADGKINIKPSKHIKDVIEWMLK
jgi:predicted ATP-dependent endonuclease of OLD family